MCVCVLCVCVCVLVVTSRRPSRLCVCVCVCVPGADTPTAQGVCVCVCVYSAQIVTRPFIVGADETRCACRSGWFLCSSGCRSFCVVLVCVSVLCLSVSVCCACLCQCVELVCVSVLCLSVLVCCACLCQCVVFICVGVVSGACRCHAPHAPQASRHHEQSSRVLDPKKSPKRPITFCCSTKLAFGGNRIPEACVL